jgi:hydrogenase expression/formation protein HypC
MCLAVPGQIISIEGDDSMTRTARVSFSGVIKEISLAYVPEAKINDYVIVHVGFALNLIDEDEARETLAYIHELDEIAEEEKMNTDS